MKEQPNVVFILADQLRARSLPAYGENQIATPNIEALADEGVTFTNAVSTCPLCTPYRSMLVTGRHPFTTGHVVNNVRTRHDEVSIADAFGEAGYTTGWIGKWHLYSGDEPEFVDFEYIPEGRDRLGFDYFRAYNYHCQFYDGQLCLENDEHECWEGYETKGLLTYVREFIDDSSSPFCLFVSPHMPHHGGPIPGNRLTQDASPGGKLAPNRFYDGLPETPSLPANVPEDLRSYSAGEYRDYLAMILAIDEMVGDTVSILESRGLLENTIVVFASDHGTLMGAHGTALYHGYATPAEERAHQPWMKRTPWEESIGVPLFVRLPDQERSGSVSDVLVSPMDFFPTLCGLCGVPVPVTVEGKDLSDAWMARPGADEHTELFGLYVNDAYFMSGMEWRGIRTKRWSWFRYLNGETGLYDLENDPDQMHNLVDDPEHAPLVRDMEAKLVERMRDRHDEFRPASEYRNWLDQRRIVRNARGPFSERE